MRSGVSAGNWLRYSDVAAAWQRTGLRGADLRDAVHELLEAGALLASSRDGVLSLSLSDSVYARLRGAEADLQLATVEDEATLLETMLRGSAGSDPGLRRRANDQPTELEDE